MSYVTKSMHQPQSETVRNCPTSHRRRMTEGDLRELTQRFFFCYIVQTTLSLASAFVFILTAAHPDGSIDTWRNGPRPYLWFSSTPSITFHPTFHSPFSKESWTLSIHYHGHVRSFLSLFPYLTLTYWIPPTSESPLQIFIFQLPGGTLMTEMVGTCGLVSSPTFHLHRH